MSGIPEQCQIFIMGCASSLPHQTMKEMEYLENYREVYFDSSGRLVKYNPHSTITAIEELKFVQENDKNPLRPGDECYIISTSWLSNWARFVNGHATEFVGPIRNEGLVSITDKQKMKIRVKLKKDYRTVNKVVWEFLFLCHGGGPVIYFSGEVAIICWMEYCLNQFTQFHSV